MKPLTHEWVKIAVDRKKVSPAQSNIIPKVLSASMAGMSMGTPAPAAARASIRSHFLQ
jgi:hypothetical protein